RDTERMVLADLIWGSAQPAGWALIDTPTPRERKFCARLGLQLPAASQAEAA
ncbi:MAG: SIR2 family protein, partial [Zoogloeaceae bacterium]|nr:SIR2 family protein [Zoogloeaceae bacterium]